jgi:putative FmdB family regulatory protein
MPIYEFDCPKCKAEYDIEMKVSSYGVGSIVCDKCHTELVRAFRTPPNFKIPSNCTYDGTVKVSGGTGASKQDSRVPINIIDENPDGSTTVTRIGKKADIENE